ncbi:Fatty acid desaturase [Streptomyces sp. DvalAA-14]|uniref:fatty acid desaturase family protein n=1 Tax=unclassified Streptomyces TaxID=2593676 RepID=UPI00081BAA74|nr:MULTISPECIES: acyl-CoA desaturase [unclassified Streptomyces]MYS23109.1 acyl-CoA desaturase [Streptomyces sp. SID4948]SCE27563.1 Fatty acid desaturase [Streptomyces sp. DvalAA-14]
MPAAGSPLAVTSVRPEAEPGRARAAPAGGSEFAPLLRQIKDAGLLRPRTGYYALMIGGNLLALAAVWAAVALIGGGGSWWVLALAAPAAVLSARTAFIGHDAGHRQIAAGARANRVLGLLHGNLLLGMGAGWWTDKHNRHHAHPNHVGKDPDVEVGALVWTRAQATRRRGFAAFLTRYQAWLFFPMLLLEGLALKVASFQDLRRLSGRDRAVEGGLLVAHVAGYTALLLGVLPPGQAIAFAAVHHALFGLHLGCSFAPNHKGMAMPEEGARWGHLRRQVLTSRNVRGNPLTDFFLGGLNYQIEHHLVPSLPRPHLRLVQPLVRAHCRRLGVPYTETGLAASYAQALRHMNAVGAPLR